MHKLFTFLKEGSGSRILQLCVLQNGRFEAFVIERGNIIAKGTGTTGDGALVNLAVGIMNVVDKPAGKGMPL